MAAPRPAIYWDDGASEGREGRGARVKSNKQLDGQTKQKVKVKNFLLLYLFYSLPKRFLLLPEIFIILASAAFNYNCCG